MEDTAEDVEDRRESQESRSSQNWTAFSELMSPKKAGSKESKKVRTSRPTNPHDPRNGLGVYVKDPAKFAPVQVIRYNDDTVLIKDAFPKSIIHLLLLPRDPTKYNLHPHEAFVDAAFLALVKREAEECVKLAALELSRLLSTTSAACQARLTALEADKPPSELPAGRDFAKELRVGIHAHPSMNHLHVHIISPDMSQPTMKHRKHYNSFNTEFFIPLKDFPLAEDDERRKVRYQNKRLQDDFECWKCGKRFGNKFKELKEHLMTEFEEWKQE